MRRPATIAFATACALGLLGLLGVAAGDERRLAFTLGVLHGRLVTILQPKDEACQRPISVAEAFDAVRLGTRTTLRPAPPLRVTVREHPGGRPLATSTVAGGYLGSDVSVVAPVRRVAAGGQVAVCVENVGAGTVGLLGGSRKSARLTALEVDGRPVPADIALDFLRGEPTTALRLVPEMFSRATLFHPGWVGAWTFWLLLVVFLTAMPALLLAALRTALGVPADGEAEA